jgi:hypothetical protein
MVVLYCWWILVDAPGFSRAYFNPGLHLSQAQGLPGAVMFDPFRVYNDIIYYLFRIYIPS